MYKRISKSYVLCKAARIPPSIPQRPLNRRQIHGWLSLTRASWITSTISEYTVCGRRKGKQLCLERFVLVATIIDKLLKECAIIILYPLPPTRGKRIRELTINVRFLLSLSVSKHLFFNVPTNFVNDCRLSPKQAGGKRSISVYQRHFYIATIHLYAIYNYS